MEDSFLFFFITWKWVGYPAVGDALSAVHGERYRDLLSCIIWKELRSLCCRFGSVFIAANWRVDHRRRPSFCFFVFHFSFHKRKVRRPISPSTSFFESKSIIPLWHSAIQTERPTVGSRRRNKKKRNRVERERERKKNEVGIFGVGRRRLIHHDVDADGPLDAAHGACRSSL